MVTRSLFAALVLTFASNATAQQPRPVAPAPSAPPSAVAPAATNAVPAATTAQPVGSVPPAPSAPVAPVAAVAPAVPANGSLRHAPISYAQAGAPIRIRASIDHPEAVRRAVLIYRGADGRTTEVAFERAPNGPYAAVIPADQVRPPSVEYAIELEDLAGKRHAAYAARADLHSIEVVEERADAQERAELARVGGRRSVFSASGEYVSFGQSQDQLTGAEINDGYYRIEGVFTYRFLRTVSEFGIRGGVVRGRSPVPDAQDSTKVGLNYGSPWARFRVTDIVHVDAQLLTSLTEKGFSGGFGGALHLGDVYGSELVLGFESIQVFGTRVYSRVDVATRTPFKLSAVVEATDTPHANRFGVRLYGEIGADLSSGFSLAVRGGYQARDSASGGPSAGVTVAYAF
jgi:hypothetical protein